MLEALYDKLERFRGSITEPLAQKLIREKEKECGVSFPEDFVDFYLYFGNDKRMLSAYYEFDSIDNITIEEGAIAFGYKHQKNGRLGIKLDEIGSRLQSVSWCPYGEEEWFVEGMYSKSFFFNIACWQVLNTMPSMVRVHISEKKFDELVSKYFCYFSDEKIYKKGYKIRSIYSGEILGCYARLDEELYLGTWRGDEVLEQCEKKIKLDFDWL